MAALRTACTVYAWWPMGLQAPGVADGYADSRAANGVRKADFCHGASRK